MTLGRRELFSALGRTTSGGMVALGSAALQ